MEQSPSSNRWCHEKEKFAHRHTQGKDPVETGVPQQVLNGLSDTGGCLCIFIAGTFK